MSRTNSTSNKGASAFLLSLSAVLVLCLLLRHPDEGGAPRNDASSSGRRHLAAATSSATKSKTATQHRRPRILYIVTTLSEYNTGTRATVRDSDRLQETTIPVVTEGIRSMLETGYDVDLALVCHYTLLPEREKLVRQALPSTVGLQVWNDATPIGYVTAKEPFTKVLNRTEHLARQHRFVIKDKLPYYDIFVNFEDDMLIKGDHVKHFEAVTLELERLRADAPDDVPDTIKSHSDAVNNYYGPMTKAQLGRVIPGFIRVEVLLDEKAYPAQRNTGPVPIDLDFGPGQEHAQADADICCQVSPAAESPHRPAHPKGDQLMLWETHVMPLGVRQMPANSWLNWVIAQRGPNQNGLAKHEVVGDYWTNRLRDYYGKEGRPAPHEFKFINNQGGWVRTNDPNSNRCLRVIAICVVPTPQPSFR